MRLEHDFKLLNTVFENVKDNKIVFLFLRNRKGNFWTDIYDPIQSPDMETTTVSSPMVTSSFWEENTTEIRPEFSLDAPESTLLLLR